MVFKRFSIALKLFIAAAVAIAIGMTAQNLVAQLYYQRLMEQVDSSFVNLAGSVQQKSSHIFNDMEERQLANYKASMDDRCQRLADTAAIYAMQPLQYGEIQIFRRVCEKLIGDEDVCALYAVYSDGSFFSGAGQNYYPAVVERVGPEAANLRVDKLAEKLLDPSVKGVALFTSPIRDLSGTARGEVRLLQIDDSLVTRRREMDEAKNSMTNAVQEATGGQIEQSKIMLADSWRSFGRLLWVAGTVTVLATGVALYLVTRLITRSLRTAVDMAEAIRSGNFNYRAEVPDKSEAGVLIAAMNNMADTVETRNAETTQAARGLREVLLRVAGVSEEITERAGVLSSTSQAVSADAETQERFLKSIASAVVQLGAGVGRSGENANGASALAAQVMDAARKGDGEMTRMTRAMEELAGSHGRVAKAMKMIDEIAFQTNLLSLNAAVEAARAGRHGKGFAVVADEVRSLAARSAKSALETEKLLGESRDSLDHASACVKSTGDSLAEIEVLVQKVAELMREIVAISGQNAQGLSDVQVSMEEISQVAIRNHRSAASAASIAERLRGMVEAMEKSLGVHRRGGGGLSRPPARRDGDNDRGGNAGALERQIAAGT